MGRYACMLRESRRADLRKSIAGPWLLASDVSARDSARLGAASPPCNNGGQPGSVDWHTKEILMAKAAKRTQHILKQYEKELLADWLAELKAAGSDGRVSETELRSQAQEFLRLLQASAQGGDLSDVSREGWAPVRDFLDEVSRTRVAQGF